MHTEMCMVHVPTAAVEELFPYFDCVDVSGNFLLPTSNATATQVHIELVGILSSFQSAKFHVHLQSDYKMHQPAWYNLL